MPKFGNPMITEIEKNLCEDFERDLFAAAQNNLNDKSNPLRLNNYSYAMRELTRHVLHRLAPDISVLQCIWYKNETNNQDGITRYQRAYYAVQGGIEDSYVKNTLNLDVTQIHKRLVKSIKQLSKHTHINQNTFNIPEGQVNQFVYETTKSVFDFFITINECRRLVIERLWEQIDSAVVEEALSETILSIDSFTSHHYIDEVYTDKIIIEEIDHESIIFKANGSLACELHWGSNSDIRKGDGAVVPSTFKFSCMLKSPVDVPDDVEAFSESLFVDTSEWENARYGLDEWA